MSFEEFPKIARLSRGCVITEKIDGTNAQVHIQTLGNDATLDDVRPLAVVDGLEIRAGSRNRWITPTADNFGFARWVTENAPGLAQLGPGRHFGEWWGAGIQRRYGLTEKRFSLFNSGRWTDRHSEPVVEGEGIQYAPECCYVVPVLYAGPFTTHAADAWLMILRAEGSKAAPGFMQPEGIVIFHEAARVLFKKTLDKDEQPKGAAA